MTQTPAQSPRSYVPANRPNQSLQVGALRPQAVATGVVQPAAPLRNGGRQSLPHSDGSTPHATTAIRYLEASPVRVQGLISGRAYEFSALQPVQTVDARDATSLLNTRFFRRG